MLIPWRVEAIGIHIYLYEYNMTHTLKALPPVTGAYRLPLWLHSMQPHRTNAGKSPKKLSNEQLIGKELAYYNTSHRFKDKIRYICVNQKFRTYLKFGGTLPLGISIT